MNDFRKTQPLRRCDVPACGDYRKYKQSLREDFHHRCGYCGDHEYFRDTFYEIDHFVPKTLAPDKENEYSNLVYSCRSCNNSKGAKWPTGNASHPNDGRIGWIDPCDNQYPVQFDRLKDGSIQGKTQLGRWMWSALSLGNPIHRLKWILEQIRVELDKAGSIDINDVNQLRLVNELNNMYRSFEEQLRGIPRFD